MTGRTAQSQWQASNSSGWEVPRKITQIYEGTNQVQRIVMGRQLLAGLPT